jgi:hypothetical protein
MRYLPQQVTLSCVEFITQLVFLDEAINTGLLGITEGITKGVLVELSPRWVVLSGEISEILG